MKEEVYSMFREYLTPEKGYRLLTIEGRENKTIIAVKIVDNRKVYKTLKGTVYESGPEAVKRLEQLGDNIIEKIRDSVEMDKNGESLFDSMTVIDNVGALLKAITASNRYDFDDLVDYSDNNIYFNYVVDYIGVKNTYYNKKLADWYWSDNYYKVMIERSPYKFAKAYNNDFVKVYGVSGRNNTSNNFEIYGIVNSDLEMAVLAGTKVSTSFELAPNTGIKILGLSCDWRNAVDDNEVLQYNTYVTDKINTQLRKISFTTSGIDRMKFVRNKKLSLRDVVSASSNIKAYNTNKNIYKNVDDYKKDRAVLAQFNQIVSDSKFGVKYAIVDSLAFIRQYDRGFNMIEAKDDKFGIDAKLLVNYEYKCGYILEGTKFRKLNVPNKLSRAIDRYIWNAYKVLCKEFSDDTGYVTKDSCLLSFTEINSILYGCDYDVIYENSIFEKIVIGYKGGYKGKRKEAIKKDEVKSKKSEKTERSELEKELEAKNKEIERLRNKSESLERYLTNYTEKTSKMIADLEQNLKNAAVLNSSLMASMLNFNNDIKSILRETKK